MSDWSGTARSNYFKVKDEPAFLAWAQSRSLEVWDEMRNGVKYFAFRPDDSSEFGDWPYFIEHEKGEPEDIHLPAELAQHLQEGSVAVLMDSGAEGFNRVTGKAVAVNSKGETVTVDLNDIYGEAEDLGTEITDADY